MAGDISIGAQGLALELFQGLAKGYERALDYATLFQDRGWKRWAVSELDLRPGNRVLDVGCGTLLLERSAMPGGPEVVGVDLTKEMLKVGIGQSHGNVAGVFNADAEHLPYRDDTFDSVVSCYVAKYVSFAAFVGELARVVKKGGKVVFYDFARPAGAFRVPLSLYFHGVLRPTGRLLKLYGSPSSTTFLKLPDLVEGSTWDLGAESILARAGLRETARRRLTGGTVAAFAAVKT